MGVDGTLGGFVWPRVKQVNEHTHVGWPGGGSWNNPTRVSAAGCPWSLEQDFLLDCPQRMEVPTITLKLFLSKIWGRRWNIGWTPDSYMDNLPNIFVWDLGGEVKI